MQLLFCECVPYHTLLAVYPIPVIYSGIESLIPTFVGSLILEPEFIRKWRNQKRRKIFLFYCMTRVTHRSKVLHRRSRNKRVHHFLHYYSLMVLQFRTAIPNSGPRACHQELLSCIVSKALFVCWIFQLNHFCHSLQHSTILFKDKIFALFKSTGHSRLLEP